VVSAMNSYTANELDQLKFNFSHYFGMSMQEYFPYSVVLKLISYLGYLSSCTIGGNAKIILTRFWEVCYDLNPYHEFINVVHFLELQAIFMLMMLRGGSYDFEELAAYCSTPCRREAQILCAFFNVAVNYGYVVFNDDVSYSFANSCGAPRAIKSYEYTYYFTIEECEFELGLYYSIIVNPRLQCCVGNSELLCLLSAEKRVTGANLRQQFDLDMCKATERTSMFRTYFGEKLCFYVLGAAVKEKDYEDLPVSSFFVPLDASDFPIDDCLAAVDETLKDGRGGDVVVKVVHSDVIGDGTVGGVDLLGDFLDEN